MRILITGGTGFIGKNLCLKLLKGNNQLVVIDNFITSSKLDFKEFLKLKNLKFFRGNITDEELIKKIQKGFKFDEIYHLACPTGVSNLRELAYEMLMACSAGTKNILDLARLQQAKVLFTSSSEVYGDPEKFPQDESYTGNVDPTGVRSPYEEGKRFAESLVKMYSIKFGVDVKITRLFNTYGPFMSLEDSRVIPQFIQAVLKGKALPVKGRGQQTRTFCYVDDLVEGLEIVMARGKRGEVYNLGGESEIKIIDLAKLFIKTVGKGRIKFIKREIHDHKSRQPSLKKVKKLGWRSKISLEEGIVKTLNSF